MLVGILAEKDTAANNFAKALGGFSGTFNGTNYVIANGSGHIFGLKSPSEQVASELTEKYKSWAIENLPWDENDIRWVYGINPGKSRYIGPIKSKLKDCDEIVIATDNDASGEGDLIGWLILIQCGLTDKKITRMRFVDENVGSVQKAFMERSEVDMTDPNYRKALYRSKWDFLSMQFTRIASTFTGTLLRQGRLKSAMVSLVGDQIKAYNDYRKVPFFANRFKDENGNVYISEKEVRFKSKDEVPGGFKESPVELVTKTRKKTSPPKYLNLSNLSSKLAPLGLSADAMLKTYQKMYEDGVLSYPRTEDKTITPEQFNELLPLVDKIADVVGVDKLLLTHRKPRATHVKPVGAHGANRPGINVPKTLSDLRSYGPGAIEIYTILAKNYLATLAEDYEYDNYVGKLTLYPDYKTSVNVGVNLNYKLVYNEDESLDSSKGLGTIAKPFVHEGANPRPQWPSQKWLLDKLEAENIGTGHTRVSTFAEVTNQKTKNPLMSEKKGKLNLSEYGQMSYEILPGTIIGSLSITERVSKEMQGIADGTFNADAGLREMAKFVLSDIDTMRENAKKIKGVKKVSENKNYGNTEKVSGVFKGKKISFYREFRGYRFTDEEVADLLAGREVNVYDLTSSGGTTYNVRGKLAKQTSKSGNEYYSYKSLGFVNKPNQPVPKSWREYTFTPEEIETLEIGGTVSSDQFVSKAGKNFPATVRYDKGLSKIIPDFSDEF